MRLLLLFIFVSCGTITKRDDYIAIDSNPRGLIVKKDKQKLGQTPLMIESPNISSTEIRIGGTKQKLECSLDWGSSIIPNGIYSLISGNFVGTGLIMYGIDWFNDKLYSCEDQLYSIKGATDFTPSEKKKLVILPIYQIENFKTDPFIKTLNKKLKKQLKDIEIIEYKESASRFAVYGVNEERRWKMDTVKQHTMQNLAHELQFSHVVEVEIKDKDSKNVSIVVYIKDYFTKKSTKAFKYTYPKSKEGFLEIDSLARRFFYLFPNAVSLSAQFSGLSFGDNENTYYGTIGSREHPNALPQIVQLVSIDSVTSPDLYDPWDWDSFFSPAAAFPSWQSFYEPTTFYDPSTNYDQEFINVSSGLFTMDYVLMTMTPMLSFSIRIGYGMGLFDTVDYTGKQMYFARRVGKLGFDFTSFLSERYYLRLAINSYALDYKFEIGDQYTSSLSRIFFGIGYYLPETRNWLY
jgi:hypothetical protein